MVTENCSQNGVAMQQRDQGLSDLGEGHDQETEGGKPNQAHPDSGLLQ